MTIDTEESTMTTSDPVNHPSHYTSHPSGVECIEITEHYGFLRGNAIKYLWRAGSKGDILEDLRKARFYLDREISGIELERQTETDRRQRLADQVLDQSRPATEPGYGITYSPGDLPPAP